jgi:hypothetical protein
MFLTQSGRPKFRTHTVQVLYISNFSFLIWGSNDREKKINARGGGERSYSVVWRWALQAGWSGVWVPAGAGNFYPHQRVRTGSGAHPASYPMGTRGLFPWGYSGRGVKMATHLHLVPRSRMRGYIPPLPQYAFMAWCSVKKEAQWQFYLYL